jgi:hypothetical protein
LETRSSQTKGGSVSGSSSDNYSSSVDVVRWAQVGGAGRGGLVGSCGCRVTEPCLAR